MQKIDEREKSKIKNFNKTDCCLTPSSRFRLEKFEARVESVEIEIESTRADVKAQEFIERESESMMMSENKNKVNIQ